jgi:DNA gyrase subunit A
VNVITISTKGLAKRTPRHLYGRQRRGGMGVFGLETPEDDPPAMLVIADESQSLITLTNFGRAFRIPVREIPETPVMGRGGSLATMLPFRLQSGERLAVVLPSDGGAHMALLSERGWVRRIRSAYLGEKMIPGTGFHDIKEGGLLVAGCWTGGDGDLFIITRAGEAIRFDEQQVPARGVRGMRVEPEDVALAITPVRAGDGVFIQGSDGKGTIRLMSGFAANKAPGAGGKVAVKSDKVVGAVAAQPQDDLFVISRLGKIIRFRAEEVPPKEGVVQGVICMALRADETVALAQGQSTSQ